MRRREGDERKERRRKEKREYSRRKFAMKGEGACVMWKRRRERGV